MIAWNRLTLLGLMVCGCAGMRPPDGTNVLAMGHAEVQLHQAREALAKTNAELERARDDLDAITEKLREALERLPAPAAAEAGGCVEPSPAPPPEPPKPSR